jgi:hypothetical protein
LKKRVIVANRARARGLTPNEGFPMMKIDYRSFVIGFLAGVRGDSIGFKRLANQE